MDSKTAQENVVNHIACWVAPVHRDSLDSGQVLVGSRATLFLARTITTKPILFKLWGSVECV